MHQKNSGAILEEQWLAAGGSSLSMRIPLSQAAPGPLYCSVLLASFLWELHYELASQPTSVGNSINYTQEGTEAWSLHKQGKCWTQAGVLRLKHKTETKATIRAINGSCCRGAASHRLLDRSHESCLWSQGSHRSVLICLKLGYQRHTHKGRALDRTPCLPPGVGREEWELAPYQDPSPVRRKPMSYYVCGKPTLTTSACPPGMMPLLKGLTARPKTISLCCSFKSSFHSTCPHRLFLLALALSGGVVLAPTS